MVLQNPLSRDGAGSYLRTLNNFTPRATCQPSLVVNQLPHMHLKSSKKTVSRATELRRVSCYNDADGMSTVVAILPAADAQSVMNSIEAFILRQNQLTQVKRCAADRRRHIYRRPTTSRCSFSNLLQSFLAEISETVTPQRRPLTVNVTIDLPTLLGLAENPGQLAGYGPIPASVARELASDAHWKRFITEPQTGHLLDFGRESYEPPQHLKDFLIARDRTCRFPGCRRSALLQISITPKVGNPGGSTSPDNIGALCRRHHRLKTHDGWSIESFADGSCKWKSPLGKEFFTLHAQ
jgi:hypothetical protein